MPVTQALPWYIIAAQWGQIVSFVAFPVFMIASIAMSVLIYQNLRKVAQLVGTGAPVEAQAKGADDETRTEGTEDEGPDISEFVE